MWILKTVQVSSWQLEEVPLVTQEKLIIQSSSLFLPMIRNSFEEILSDRSLPSRDIAMIRPLGCHSATSSRGGLKWPSLGPRWASTRTWPPILLLLSASTSFHCLAAASTKTQESSLQCRQSPHRCQGPSPALWDGSNGFVDYTLPAPALGYEWFKSSPELLRMEGHVNQWILLW